MIKTTDLVILKISDNREPVNLAKEPIALRYVTDEQQLRLITKDSIVAVNRDDIIRIATLMQNGRRTEPKDVEDVDHQKLVAEVIKHLDDNDGSVQVLEGGVEEVKVEHFSGDNAENIIEVVNFIKANSLQEDPRWRLVWNLFRCMMVAAGAK